MFSKFLKDESGATAIEYGLVAALISIALIASARLLGGDINTKFTTVGSEVTVAGDEYLQE